MCHYLADQSCFVPNQKAGYWESHLEMEKVLDSVMEWGWAKASVTDFRKDWATASGFQRDLGKEMALDLVMD